MSLVKSPLNYTGGKFKLLSQLAPMFPKNIETFYDPFCGGANVAVNAPGKVVCASDINTQVIDLFNYLQATPLAHMLQELERVRDHFGLSDSKTNGYDFYKCNSSAGLASFNKSAFSLLKKEYNRKDGKHQFNKNILFYALVVFGFNNQIRFNKSGEFNMPVGKRDFNARIAENFQNFVKRVQSTQVQFVCQPYTKIAPHKDDFVYLDPPYLISTAAYNESKGWTEESEKKLLEFLLGLDKRNIRFALSNVIEHKGQKNELLEKWAGNHKFNIHDINMSYSNSNYQVKKKTALTREVLITNYKKDGSVHIACGSHAANIIHPRIW